MDVVFDTNVYRGIGDPELNSIITLERAHEIRPVMNLVVAYELINKAWISKLNNDSDSLHKSMLAISRLLKHCDATSIEPHIIQIGDMATYRTIFMREPPEDEREYEIESSVLFVLDNINTLIESISDDTEAHELSDLSNIWMQMEKDYLDQWKIKRDGIVAKKLIDIDKYYQVRDISYAQMITETYLSMYPDSTIGVKEASNRLLLTYPLSMRLGSQEYVDIIENRNNLGNNHADYQISFSIEIEDENMPDKLLITDDKRILKAAAEVGVREFVMKKVEYKKWLQDSSS